MHVIEDSTSGRRLTGYVRALLLAMFAVPFSALAQTVAIGAGDRWQTDDAVVDLDCAALDVAGNLDAGNAQIRGIRHLSISGQVAAQSASIAVGGDWINHGSFLAGNGTVAFGDRCDEALSMMIGSSAFSTLQLTSARGKVYGFEAGQTQFVLQGLALAGTTGNRLSVRSTQPGSHASIALSESGLQQISWIDVADMEAPVGSAWIAPATPESFNSIDSGNNVRWFQRLDPVQLPAISLLATITLALGLVLLAMRSRRLRHGSSG